LETIGVSGGIWTGSFSSKGAQDILVYIGTFYRPDGSGFEPRQRQKNFLLSTRFHNDPPDEIGPNRFILQRVSGSFPHLGPRLIMTRAKHLAIHVRPLNPDREADGRSYFHRKQLCLTRAGKKSFRPWIRIFNLAWTAHLANKHFCPSLPSMACDGATFTFTPY
jgi:hypothetical protein